MFAVTDPEAAAQRRNGISAFLVPASAKGFVVQRVMQAHGAIGMTSEMGLTEIYKTLRLINIADGTNEILRRTIAKEMLAGDVDL